MIIDLFKRSSFHFVGLGVGKVVGTVLFILFARHFKPEIFGDLLLFIMLIEVTTVFAGFGLNQWYHKKYKKSKERQLFGRVITARLATLVASIVLLALFLFINQNFSSLVIISLLFSLMPEAGLFISDGYYLERKKMIPLATRSLLKMIFILIVFILKKDSFSFLDAVVSNTASSFFALAIFFPWKIIRPFPKFSFKQSLHDLKSSLSYAVLIATSFVYARGDALLISSKLGSVSLGLYGAAYRYIEGIGLLPRALTENLFPVAAKKGGISLSQLLKISFLMSVAGVVLAMLLYALAPFLTITLLGVDYAGAVPLVKVLSIVVFLFFINAPLSSVVQSSKRVKQFLPFGIINTLLNISLNAVFLLKFGVIAAAWIMVFTEFTGFIINCIFVQKLYSSNRKVRIQS